MDLYLSSVLGQLAKLLFKLCKSIESTECVSYAETAEDSNQEYRTIIIIRLLFKEIAPLLKIDIACSQ